MKVLITGVNGFIANSLAKHLHGLKINTYGTSSRKIDNVYCLKTYSLKIGDVLDIDIIDFDWVIHCVYDKTLSAMDNTQSTIAWAEALKKRGIKHQMFISSISVVSGNSSEYSRTKYETESWFLQNNFWVVRPGLVVGEGGLFEQMIKKVINLPVLPLIASGRQNIKLIGLKDLIQEIANILNGSHMIREMNIFYNKKYILKDLLKDIAKFYNKRIVFITIPYWLIFYSVRLLELLKINVGVTSQNIKGLISNEMEINSHIHYNKEIMQILKENLLEQK